MSNSQQIGGYARLKKLEKEKQQLAQNKQMPPEEKQNVQQTGTSVSKKSQKNSSSKTQRQTESPINFQNQQQIQLETIKKQNSIQPKKNIPVSLPKTPNKPEINTNKSQFKQSKEEDKPSSPNSSKFQSKRRSVLQERLSNISNSQGPNFQKISIQEEDRTSKQQNIRVFARVRPVNNSEIHLSEQGLGNICCQFKNQNTIGVKHGEDEQIYQFDEIFGPETTQTQIFEKVSRKSLNDVLKGFNATLFVYGQTGSGKTYSMYGQDLSDTEQMGIVPRAIDYLFTDIDPDIEFEINYQMLEIYKEQIFDLLSLRRENLQIKESSKKGIFVEGLTTVNVASFEESMQCLEFGSQNKSITSTRINQYSSRAHTLFMVSIKQRYSDSSEKKGFLNLIDLAGSEKVSKSGAEGETLEEAKKINLSLSQLGTVINALSKRNEFIPYRDSKLTRLLQDSLGGNYKTTLIVCCSPHSSNIQETCTSLKFGARAKNIKTEVKMNIVMSPETMQKMIDDLKSQLDIKEQIISAKGFNFTQESCLPMK